MNLIITQELLQKVLNYLARQPYIEVVQLISELSQLKKVEQDKSNQVS